MERARKLKLRTYSLVLAASGLCFLAGWNIAGRRSLVSDQTRPTENTEPNGNATVPHQIGETVQSSSLSGGGTFAALLAMEAEAAGLKPEDWARLWRKRMRTGEHNGLARHWVKADPLGALKAALAAADEASLSDQESYDFQYLGGAAIDELFSRSLPEALRGMSEWRETYGAYPRLDCLHLLVTGDAAQKAALADFLRKEGPEKIHARITGDSLNVLEALDQPGMPSRPDIQGDIVWETIQTRPVETVDWMLKQAQPISPKLMERALNGFRAVVGSSRETTEAMERLLEIAPPDMVDEYAEDIVSRKASYDPEGARLWAEEHVPEAKLKEVLQELAK